MKKLLILGLISGSFSAQAACLYGSASNSDGSKIDGSARVSTSWNGKKAYPRNGKYRLCFNGNPNAKMTVYLDGKKSTRLYVRGDTRLDLVRR